MLEMAVNKIASRTKWSAEARVGPAALRGCGRDDAYWTWIQPYGAGVGLRAEHP
jgi:hypothetical protein